MKKRKIIIYSFLLIIFLVSIQRVIVNIISYPNGVNLDYGMVYKVEGFTDSDGYSSMNSFYIKDKHGEKYEGVYSNKENFSLTKGDTVAFRKLYNGSVRAIKKNRKKIQSYYDFWDYGSIITTITLVLTYFYFPKILKKIKE